MSDILQIFSGNPLSTYIGKEIEAATHPELESEDWALNMKICDIINENDDDAKDAVRAIKKRLQQIEHDRDFSITNKTLTVLETCVSNCSRRFHVLVMTKDFIQDLVKLIGPKNNPPIDLQERVLRLIERWAEAFKGQPDLSGVVTVYNELKAKGVTFPPKDPNSYVPIQTPQRSVPHPAVPQPQQTNLSPTMAAFGQQAVPGQVVLEGDGYSKISQDLTVVQSSIDMFNDIIGILEASLDDSDWNLAADLNATCQQMKSRIVDLIERVANEDLTVELLRLNDDLNTIFNKYDRMVKNRCKTIAKTQLGRDDVQSSDTNQQTTSKIPSQATSSTKTRNEMSLIDFNADGTDKDIPVLSPTSTFGGQQTSSQGTSTKPKSPGIVEGLKDLSLKSSQAPTSAKPATNIPEEISTTREQDFAEIENWLLKDAAGGDSSSIEPISIPNSEFENFIASRALAGSSEPTTTQTTSETSTEPKQLLKNSTKPNSDPAV